MKSQNSGVMNTQDPLQQNIGRSQQNNQYYISQSGPNQMNSNIMKQRKDNQGLGEIDYNYSINITGDAGGAGSA
jgi:hypothetical protein